MAYSISIGMCRADGYPGVAGATISCAGKNFTLVLYYEEYAYWIELNDPSNPVHRKRVNTHQGNVTHGFLSFLKICLHNVHGWVYYMPKFMEWWSDSLEINGLGDIISELHEINTLALAPGVQLGSFDLQKYGFSLSGHAWGIDLLFMNDNLLHMHLTNPKRITFHQSYTIPLNKTDAVLAITEAQLGNVG